MILNKQTASTSLGDSASGLTLIHTAVDVGPAPTPGPVMDLMYLHLDPEV